MKNQEELDKKKMKFSEKLAEKKLCIFSDPFLVERLYIKHSFDELDKPISYVQNKFDEAKYNETGFFLVLDSSVTENKTNYFFANENCDLVIPCKSFENRRWYEFNHDITVDQVMTGLLEDLSSYIARNPAEASKIPAETFSAIPFLDEQILTTYQEVKQEENLEMATAEDRTEFVENIRSEVSELNRVFNEKEREINGAKLDANLFARNKTL